MALPTSRFDDKTGWEIIWRGSDPLLPPRESKPSEVWSTESKRKYTRSGRYNRKLPNSSAAQLETDNEQGT